MERMYMSADETAEFLGISLSTFKRHYAKTLARYRIGERWKYRKDEVENDIKKQRVRSSF